MIVQPPDSALVLVNPVSGRAQGAQAMGRVERAFRRCGVQASVVLISEPDAISREVEQKAPEMSAVVAVGGDGTISQVAKAIISAGGDWPLGLIPLGFGNCLARSFGLPLDIESAAEVIARGRARALDIAWVRDRPVVYALGAGFDADVLIRVDKARTGGVRLRDYLKGVWSAFCHYDWPWIEVEVDGRPLKNRYSQVILSPVHVYAVFFKLISGPGIRVYLFRSRPPKALYYLPAMGLGRNLARAADLCLEVKHSLKMTAAINSVPLQIDGEIGGFLPATCEIKPAALKIFVP
ncbi:MAG: hypothetical protein JRI34_10710 [Deltaproteobacteria bacterium]|nr:hypothetical protein [Deltaproteobacteria bacterium]